ncbi:hypothetical protein MPSEU_000428600 [Mayamaea pseudoterrestris]|nr:hypothetical protein MPSEU_000428600 [Mayamaea pseudoterrestris]
MILPVEAKIESLPFLDVPDDGAGILEVQDVDNGDDRHHRRAGRWSEWFAQVRQAVHILRHVLMLLMNICAWYATNGMNGIAMQKAAVALREDHLNFVSVLANTTLITAVQLLLGAILGRLLLYVYAITYRTKPVSLSLGFDLSQPAQILLAALHSIGSIATNLGFMFGSASLVQIIKLMEPFQTLILTKLCSEEGKKITLGIITSMSVTVGAAVSLIKSRQQQPPLLAVLFALLSGFTLSSRNVLQRHQYMSKPMTTRKPSLQDEHGPLERALVQFTQISLQSGLLVTTLMLPVLFITPMENILYAHPGALTTFIDVFAWHPLYNAFSMITLGFCSALTHSLLNAGKRVVAIAMAIIWFKERFTTRNIMGLLFTLVGGCWYTCESQSKGRPQRLSWFKVGPAFLILW